MPKSYLRAKYASGSTWQKVEQIIREASRRRIVGSLTPLERARMLGNNQHITIDGFPEGKEFADET